MNKLPLVTRKLQRRLWILIGAAIFFLVYSSLSSFLPGLWLKLRISSGDKIILTVGLAIILVISLSGLILAERMTPTLLDYLAKNRFLELGEASLFEQDDTQAKFGVNYFNNLFCELQKELSQVNQHTKSLADANKSLAVIAVRDGLSGLYNQYYIRERLQQEIFRSERYKRPLSLLMIDIDDFKLVNDMYGHMTGDQTLKAFSRILTNMIRPSDIPSRYGGDEFLLILPETAADHAGLVAERVRQKIALHVFSSDQKEGKFQITVSVGICTFPDFGYNAESLISFADTALYKAKKKGKNRIVTYEEQGKNELGRAIS